jgi:uncharacterized protein (DUF885 family)
MKKILQTILVSILFSCQNTPQSNDKYQADANPRFESYREKFIESLWQLYPGWASSVGYHRYDSVLILPNQGQREKEILFMTANLDSLQHFQIDNLSDNNKTDLSMIRDFLNASIWGIDTLKSFEWDPSIYNICGGFAEMLNNNYDSLDTRLRNFYQRMVNVKSYYDCAKQNIKNPTKEHTALAILQNEGGWSVFEQDLNDAIKKSKLSNNEKDQMNSRAKEVVAAIKDYVTWLKGFKNENPRSFRLGKTLYTQKFNYDLQSSYSADQIYEKALSHKLELHKKMFEITKMLWPKYMANKSIPSDHLIAIKELIDVISLKHVTQDSFQLAIENQIPTLTEFIKRKNLIDLDPSKPLVVRKEPAYMAGLAGASISSPGPYDKNGNTYYNVGSLAGWDQNRAESYLREYNYYILQILNIHEAIPGHYMQLIYSNQSPSIIKSIFGSGSMVEGWAVYSERMMLENGYGAVGNSNEASPEMWLMYYKWNLRSTCNTILDYCVHTKNMAKEEAINLLMNEAFQQQAEAEGKWRRVSISQVQLCCYFTGYTEIYDFRETYKKLKGNKFNLKEFHEKFLSYGSAPVKYISALMLNELKEPKNR